MATARKRGDKWRALAFLGTVNGKKKYKSFTASTKKEAERLAAAYVAEQDRKESADITLREAIDIYINSKVNALSPRSIVDYKSIRDSYLQDLMHRKIKTITKADLQFAFDKEAAHLSPKSVRCICGLISATFDMQELPFPKITLPKMQKKEMQIPTEEEVELLIAHLDSDPDMKLAVMLAAFMGLRRSEICALKMSDFQNGKLSINKAMVKDEHKEWIVKQPKSTAGYRQVEAPSRIQTEIGKLKKGKKDNLVDLVPDVISMRFKRAKERSGITNTFRFHDLRHYYASVMLSLGIPDKYVMERIGHSTNTMLQNVYQHTIKQKQDEFSALIDKHFSK